VRHDHKGDIPGKSRKASNYELLTSLIKVRGRLIQHHNRALKEKTSSYVDTLLLTRGESHPFLPYLRVEPLWQSKHKIAQSEVMQKGKNLII
jgi:hypothetical protein